MNNLYQTWYSNYPEDNELATGGAVELQYSEDGSNWKYRQLVLTGKLSGISNGLRMDNVVVMGSHAWEGYLVCPIDESIPFLYEK